jgi:ABC-type antimicrobial peptide transport system permease subunit
MIQNYFKIAWRNFVRNKLFSFINITGLATGMAVAILIGLWIWDEVTFDRYHHNHNRLAQVYINQSANGETEAGTTVAMPLGEALATKYAGDFKYVSLASGTSDHLVKTGDKILRGKGMWVQKDFPMMLTLQILNGDQHALKDPSSIFISQRLAKALFGDTDPLHKILRLDNKLEMKIAAVYKDLPHNTTFYGTQILLPWDNKENRLNKTTAWDNHCGQLFVQLNEGAGFDKVTEKIKNVPTPYIKDWNEVIFLHPMDQWHLYNEFKNGKNAGGRIQFVRLFGVIGIFVLLLACINFMNLSTARSEKRAREVGIRKTVGSMRGQLIRQFLFESVFMALLAFSLSILLVQLSLPFFNGLSDKKIVLPATSPLFWLLLIGFSVITGLLSGSYPAFYLSGFQPIKVLKGTFLAGRLVFLPRKVLVIIQFAVSIALIIGTIIIYRQIQFAKDRPIGYERNGLVSVPMNTPQMQDHYEAIHDDLLRSGVIENMAISSQSVTHFANNNGLDWDGKDPGYVVFFRDVNVSKEFGSTIGWQISRGRDFSKDFATDSSSVLLNETAAKIIGFENPIGKVVRSEGKPYVIVGIVKDMITQSPYEPAEPSVFFCGRWFNTMTIRIKPTIPVHTALAKIGSVIKTYSPDGLFDYQFTDEIYDRKFKQEERIGSLATFFAVLAIFISCLGLFGLASFVAAQRTKEVGIRKVLGAGIVNLWKLLSKDFVMPVFIALLVATPIAYYFMNNWLQNYSYRTSITWWIFAAAGIGALAITLLTVSFQAIKAALANPVKSIRTE